MLRRVMSALQDALGLRGRPTTVKEQYLAAANEAGQLFHAFFRCYMRYRFGPDVAKSEAIMRQYEDWAITAEFRVHRVAAHGRGVLIPVRLLDGLAAELNIVPVTTDLPPWAVDEELDERSRRSYGVGFLARDPEGVLSVAAHERESLRTLAAQYPGAT